MRKASSVRAYLWTLLRTLLTSSSLPVTSAATWSRPSEREPMEAHSRRVSSHFSFFHRQMVQTHVSSDGLGSGDGAEGGRIDESPLVFDPDEGGERPSAEEGCGRRQPAGSRERRRGGRGQARDEHGGEASENATGGKEGDKGC